jgi:HPt (histidine-containing phosphotransfer) domain-containing protein
MTRLAPRVLRSELAGEPDIARFLPDFVGSLPEKVAALVRLRRKTDLDQLKDALHQLKGCGGLYGFPAITDSAERAETRIEEDEPLDAVRQSVNELVQLVRSVEGYDASREQLPPQVNPGTPGQQKGASPDPTAPGSSED